MGIYIVQADRPVPLPSLSDAPKRRVQRLDEMVMSWSADPLFRDIRRWMAELKATARTVPSMESLVTGTVVVELSEEEAERLPREVPGARVTPDQPIGLIRTRHRAGTDKPGLDEKDLWHLNAIGLTTRRSSSFPGTGKGVTVAVLDTGIDASHPELTGKVTEAYTFDPTTGQPVPMVPPADTDGHGTLVAGLLCGSRIGVAPEAVIVSGVMLPRGLGNASDFVRALNWVVTRTDVRIVNVSAGILNIDETMLNAVAGVFAAGILPVFATGDAGASGQTYSPGNYDLPLSVGASTEQNRVAVFSSGGTLTMGGRTFTVPDLVAPGEQVWSSVRGGGYAAFDGTSLSAPIVSGVAALIVEKHPTISVADLMQQLVTSCKHLGRPRDRQGAGLVQVPP